MKQHLNYWLALALLLPALNACQDDDTLPGKTDNEGKTTRVSASIGDKPDTRAQVHYGTQDPKDGEFFMWNAGDKFYALKFSDVGSLTANTFTIAKEYNEATPSKTADFACEGFSSNKGETILALYGNMGSPKVQNDGKKGIKVMTINMPPIQEKKTTSPGNADLKHLQRSIYMYATTTAGEDGSLPSLSFRHLSALCRVSLTNSGTEAIEVSEIRLEFGKEDNIVCLAGNLTVWEDGTYTYSGGNPTNYIAMGLTSVTLAASETYDLFIPFMPMPNSTASAATIELKFKGGTWSNPVSIAGFNNVEIEAGMRYWFDLTVKADGTLAQTGTLWDGASPTSPEDAKAWLGAETSGAGDPDAANHLFTITTARQLAAMRYLVNKQVSLNTPSSLKYAAATYRLGADIDLKDEAWTPIGTSSVNYFQGTFDGQGYHISGLKVDNGDADFAGLFGDVEDNGTVKNLRVSGDVTTTGNYAGGIVGYLYGNCVVENCIFSGNVNGANYVGGIAGYNFGNKIAGCYTAGSVTATGNDAGGIAGENSGSSSIDNCYSEATVKANQRVGGIVGYNSSSKSTVTHCYATGNVSGSQFVGGIAGRNSSGTVEECIALNSGLTRTEGSSKTTFGRVVGFNDGTTTDCGAFNGMTMKDANDIDITPSANAEQGTALTAAECLTKATYTGRSFPAAPATPGWAFDSGSPWTYLPWNPAFESFPGIAVADYRIPVPQYIKDAPSN